MTTELAGNLIIESEKILLLYRKDEGHWEVPGGKVEEDENPTQAAVRKAKEEINIEVELQKPFYSGEFQHNNEIFLWHGYIAEFNNGEPELNEDKFEKLGWFRGQELDEMDLAPNLNMILPALRKLDI